MKPLRLVSMTEQVASHLRKEIESGVLAGDMPGAKKIANQLGINHKTADAAAALLEKQGLLESQGIGKPRRIIQPKDASHPSMRIAILIYEPDDAQLHLIIELRHVLGNAGHSCIIAEKSQMELNWDVKRVASLVKKTKADAWIVQSSSRAILEWFSEQPTPSIALHGAFIGLPLAASGVSMIPAINDAVDQLVALGHRRIVMLAQKSDLVPTPCASCKAFLERLEGHGIKTNDYNLPLWESSPNGLHESLKSLFKLTPPSAIFVTDVVLFFPTYLHLLRQGLRVPEDVSLICTDDHPQFNWCVPSVSHFKWDWHAATLRILDWANNMATGNEDKKQKLLATKFISKETIGPAPALKV